MKEFWNDRYKNPDYAYGIHPNNYLKEKLEGLKGNILLPCEGEGRNAVYAALHDFRVNAFDLSEEGKQKALKLAATNNVDLNYDVAEFESIHFEPNSFDVIALIYAHFAPNLREAYHKQLIKYLKSGGVIIIEGFSKKNIELSNTNPKIGGPKNIDMLYSIEMFKNDFAELEIIELKEELVDLNEGLFHIGKGSVVRFVGRKKK